MSNKKILSSVTSEPQAGDDLSISSVDNVKPGFMFIKNEPQSEDFLSFGDLESQAQHIADFKVEVKPQLFDQEEKPSIATIKTESNIKHIPCATFHGTSFKSEIHYDSTIKLDMNHIEEESFEHKYEDLILKQNSIDIKPCISSEVELSNIMQEDHNRSSSYEDSTKARLQKENLIFSSSPPMHKRNKTEKRFACGLCTFKSPSNSKLTIHMRIHTGEKPFECELCDYKTARKGTFLIHTKKHTGENTISCKLCEFKTVEKYKLNRHMITHTNEKPLRCNMCDYRTGYKSALLTHIRNHTGEKPYECKLCPAKFIQARSLTDHMRVHTGDKPFACDVCDFRTTRRCTLVTHMERHTGNKYPCNLCKYKTFSKSRLLRHALIHQDKKPKMLTCDSCEFQTVQKATLAKHLKAHMDEKLQAGSLCD